MKITIKNLTKTFPARKKTEQPVTAVNNMCVEIPSGKLVGLLGPSGCGKSTTLFMLSGLEDPTSGQIFFGDDDVTELDAEKRGIGLVFQNYALYPHMTVEQNIMFPLLNMRIPKEEARKRAYETAGLVQIQDLMARKPSELSGGQQQRVAIARALVKLPNVLLLDEPLSNLDARLRLQTREEIKRIQVQTGITTVFVTHDQEEAMSICDIMVVMKLGVVQQVGVPQEIYDNPDNLFVANFLGTPPINIFTGELRGKDVYIGDQKVYEIETTFYENHLNDLKREIEDARERAAGYAELVVDLERTVNEPATTSEMKAAQAKAARKLKRAVPLAEAAKADAERIEAENMARIAECEKEIEADTHKIYVGIRPEGFIYNPNGVLTMNLDHVEVMGRDKSIVSTHPSSQKATVRTIIDAETKLDDTNTYSFDLKPSKVFIFDRSTEKRMR